jgi:type III secretion protein T
MAIFGPWADQALLLGLTTTRFSVAFAAIPLFSNETVPSTVRNSIFVSLGLIVLVMVPPVSVEGLSSVQWIKLFGKEVFVGLVIGYFFGSVLWELY